MRRTRSSRTPWSRCWSPKGRVNAMPRPAASPDGPRPGDLVTTTIARAAPHYLISDRALAAPLGELSPEQFSVRRTFSGDAWEAGVRGSDGGASCGTGGGGPAGPVSLGLPSLRV